MKVFVSGTTATVRVLAEFWPDHLGLMRTPGNRNSIASAVATGLPWVIDNGAFSGFNADGFRNLLRRAAGKPGLLWVVCPDVVGDAGGTLAMFDVWQPELVDAGVPVAFVGQDGQEDLPVPWDRFDALFIGGSTKWKLSEAAGELGREAKRREKWLHMGRVNSRRRLQSAYDMGCDSVDGSSLSMFGDKYIHKFCAWVRQIEQQPTIY